MTCLSPPSTRQRKTIQQANKPFGAELLLGRRRLTYIYIMPGLQNLKVRYGGRTASYSSNININSTCYKNIFFQDAGRPYPRHKIRRTSCLTLPANKRVTCWQQQAQTSGWACLFCCISCQLCTTIPSTVLRVVPGMISRDCCACAPASAAANIIQN